jgi:hypothetical protein
MTEPERADGSREQIGSWRGTPLGLRSVAGVGPSPPHVAVGEILQQILASPEDSDTALKAVLETAMRLLAAQAAAVWRTDQEKMRISAVAGAAAALLQSAGAEVDAFDQSRQAFARGEPFVRMADGSIRAPGARTSPASTVCHGGDIAGHRPHHVRSGFCDEHADAVCG